MSLSGRAAWAIWARQVATVLIVIVYLVLVLAIAVTVAIGLFRGRRHIRWRTPGYNMFSGKWSDEPDQDEKPKR